MENSVKEYVCPICGASGQLTPRYTKAVCGDCSKRAKSPDGLLLKFSNIDLGGGFQAKYAESDEKYKSHQCFIDNIECYADEAHMGGIVIEVGVRPSRFTEKRICFAVKTNG
jgi:diaminopimelate decarboxylase